MKLILKMIFVKFNKTILSGSRNWLNFCCWFMLFKVGLCRI